MKILKPSHFINIETGRWAGHKPILYPNHYGYPDYVNLVSSNKNVGLIFQYTSAGVKTDITPMITVGGQGMTVSN